MAAFRSSTTSGSASGANRPPTETDPRWLFLDLNSYFASVEQHLNPALQDKPVAVLPVLSKGTSVIAASVQAKRYGIKTGTPVWQAEQRCPEIIFVQGRHEHYVRLHHQIVAQVEQHLPVTQICSIDEMACRLHLNDRPAARALALAKTIKQGIIQQIGPCLTCSIGLAPNRFWAKVATDMQKPDGLVYLTPEQLPEALFTLALNDLPGIGHGMSQRLHAAGISNTRLLWDLGARQLKKIWGSVLGERFWYALHGYDLPDEASPNYFSAGSQQKSIGHSHVMAPEMRPPQAAYLVARRLLVKAASRLRRTGYVCSGLALYLRFEDDAKPRYYSKDFSFAATQDTFSLLETLKILWQPIVHTQGLKHRRIKKAGIVLYGLLPQGQASGNLFAQLPDGRIQKQQKLSELMDTLNSRYGRDTLMLGVLPDMHRQDTGSKIAFNRIPNPAEFHE
ncbi:MAG: hypothetical protein VKJ06_09395 [Vampirovibrionales bacterium]|nr:hypothetical protein [Vampirovibrionales bacterium]